MEQICKKNLFFLFKINPLQKKENLPEFYQKVYIFDDFGKTMKKGLFDSKINSFAFNGFYIKITIQDNFDLNVINNHPKESPLVNE